MYAAMLILRYHHLIVFRLFPKTGDYLREQYEQATQVKMNKRGRLQVKDSRYKVPTALDLVYLDESPDWCRANKQLQWPGTMMIMIMRKLCTWHLNFN